MLATFQKRFAAEGNLQAVFWMLCMTICIAGMHAIVRHLSADIHVFEIGFFRNAIAALFILPLALRAGLGELRTQNLRLHLVRAIIQLVALLLFFTALGMSPLALLSALSFLAPLFTTLIAIFFLSERVRLKRWSALFFGFAGAMVVLQPGAAAIDPGALLAVGSSALWAVVPIIIKVMTRTDSNVTIVVYQSFLMTPLSLIPALFVWVWPTWDQLFWLTLIGAAGAFGQLAMTHALRLGDASLVMPLDFMRLVWATLLGFLLFAEIPDIWTWIGGTMIFAAAVYIAYRESQLKKGQPDGEPPPVQPV